MDWYKTAQQYYAFERFMSKEDIEEFRDLKSKLTQLSNQYVDILSINNYSEESERKASVIMVQLKEIDNKIQQITKNAKEEAEKERSESRKKQEDSEKQTIRRYKNIRKIGPQLEEYARKHFPVTNDIYLAGYIMSNGDMLAFSYRGDKRDVDHRYITEAFPENTPIDSGTDGMNQFMIATGAIRINTGKNFFAFDIMVTPTTPQMRILTKCLEKNNVEISFNRDKKDFSSGNEESMAKFVGFKGYIY